MATEPPALDRAYLVFAQGEPRIDLAAWDAHARRFFAASLAVDVTEGAGTPPFAVRLAVTVTSGSDRGKGGARRAFVRARNDDDLALADRAEVRAGGGGLAGLARRCPTVWIVAREADDDSIALRLAAVLASVLLGPILDVRGPEMFGVKTARAKLGA